MKVLVMPFQEGDFSVIVIHIDLVLSGECIVRSHIDPSFHPPFEVKIL